MKRMEVEKPVPFNLHMEIIVRQKNEDPNGFNRVNEIIAKINKVAGFDFCGFISDIIQPRTEEPERVKFLAHKKIKNFDLFVEQLKTELGIDVQYQWEFEN